jgi:hypothetical protein
MVMKYSYIAADEEQYDPSSFSEGVPVKARYRHAGNQFDAGNPFIEALPLPREGRDTLLAYTRTIPDTGIRKGQSRADAILKVSLLRQLRFPLPFHQELEDECYAAIVNSYRDRHVIGDTDIDLKIVNQNQTTITHQILAGDIASATDAGFHMIGYSGCGKSSALQILFANYPQYIIHEGPDHTRIPQITYLVVTCQPNSNFRALYESIGHAIDRALGNITPVYEYEIQKAAGLAGKAERVRRYIEQFAIGIIVFDEIQLIDFGSTRENSFEGLMTLANQTKVAMAVVGTEDAYDKMFTNLRTSRRLGGEILASSYCEDRTYFNVLVTSLFRYQWFGAPVALTEGMADALYQASAGIVDQLIGIYMYMQIDFLRAAGKPVVDEEYIRRTVDRHYPGIQGVLTDMRNPLNDKKRAAIARVANEEMTKVLDSAKQERFKAEITAGMDAVAADKRKIDAVIDAITTVTDAYNTKTIEKEAVSVLKTRQAAGMSDKELTRRVMERLKNRHTDRRPRARKASKVMDEKHIVMKNFLEEDTGI